MINLLKYIICLGWIEKTYKEKDKNIFQCISTLFRYMEQLYKRNGDISDLQINDYLEYLTDEYGKECVMNSLETILNLYNKIIVKE